ncbi:MAG: dihydrofolate reductase family protein [Actinomycetes bacterium]
MSIVRVSNLTISLDGFVAGPEQSEDNPLGVGASGLHAWAFQTRSFLEAHGMDASGIDGTSSDVDEAFAARGTDKVGAHIMGRNMFGPIRGAWPDDSWRGWWGENPPFHHPVFVLTHHPREPLEMDGGTTFYFVSDGIESALAQAREAAGAEDVLIGGGALTVREFLDAGLIDEMHLAVVPVLLGTGERLFDGSFDVSQQFTFEPVQSSSAVAHFVLRRS